MSHEPAKNHWVSNLIEARLVILSGANDFQFHSEHAQGNKSQMFRFAQHEESTIDCSIAAGSRATFIAKEIPVRALYQLDVCHSVSKNFYFAKWRNLGASTDLLC